MELSELEEYENKLLIIIENLKYDEELLDEVRKVIDYHSLESLLRKTSNQKILEVFANDFINQGNRDVHLAEDIAKNMHASHIILDKLSEDTLYIGRAVAQNTSTSTVTLLWMHKYSNDIDITRDAEAQLSQRRVVLEDNGNIQEF